MYSVGSRDVLLSLSNQREDRYPKQGSVIARKGMVSCSSPVSSQIGIDVLRSGGNAVDAAIAMGAAQNVVEPTLCHLGGDCFMLVHLSESGKTFAINGSGRSPKGATLGFYQQIGGIPKHGPLSCAVPGAVGAWATANRLFGTRPLGELLKPAVGVAREGFPVPLRLSRYLGGKTAVFENYSGSRSQYMPKGKPLAPGDILVQPYLAETLEEIGDGGEETFYRGRIAERIVSEMAELGGLLTLEDLAEHETSVLDPIQTEYRGRFTVQEQPLISQGILLLMALNILDQFDVVSMDPGSEEYLRLVVETLRSVYSERDIVLGDPESSIINVDRLMSHEWAAQQARMIESSLRGSQRVDIERSRIVPWGTDFFCVADGNGNFVTHIHSLYSGSGMVLGDTGIMMNSRMLGFSMDAKSPNALAPSKRPLHTLNTYMVLEDHVPCLIGGSTGGDLQIAFNLQIITNFLDRRYSVQDSIDAPRISMREYDKPFFENRFPDSSLSSLRASFPDLYKIEAWGTTGRAQAISYDHDSRILIGGAESRDDGSWCLGII